jgi:hypothetical protein
MSEAESGGQGGSGSVARLVFAGGLAAILAIVVAATLILGTGDEGGREFAAAPNRCIDQWNSDPDAVSLGQHQFDAPPTGHGYLDVQVTTLSADGAREVAADDPGSICALVFAAPALDPEVGSAVQVWMNRGWHTLFGVQSEDRIAAMQIEAQSAYNAQLGPDGTITAL